ncbi:MAG: tetratricopeptide repeat protein, partial [Bacteroidota bacterium]
MREHFLLLLLSFCISYLSAQSDSVLAVQYYKNGDSLIYEGLYYDAISQLEEAVELGKRAFGEQSSFNAKTLRALGTAQGYVYQLKKSQQSLQQSIKIYEALNDVKSRDYANSIGELASTLSSLGNYEKSIIYWLKVQDLYYDLFEEGDGVFAPLYYNIGNTYLGKEDANLALEYFERALALDRKRGDDLAIADDYDNIGVAYDLLGKYDKALQYFNDAIAIYGTEVGVMSDYYAHVLLQKASSLKKMGQPQEAIGPLMNALKISYQIFGPINSESAAILDLMGECYTALGEYELAEDKFNSALAALNYDETQNVLTEVDHLDQLVQVLGHKAGL